VQCWGGRERESEEEEEEDVTEERRQGRREERLWNNEYCHLFLFWCSFKVLEKNFYHILA
jgi:hypothetical protein